VIDIVFTSDCHLRAIGGFTGCRSLRGTEIRSSVKIISQYGFLKCTSLNEVRFASALFDCHLKQIDGFVRCTSLLRIEIASSVQAHLFTKGSTWSMGSLKRRMYVCGSRYFTDWKVTMVPRIGTILLVLWILTRFSLRASPIWISWLVLIYSIVCFWNGSTTSQFAWYGLVSLIRNESCLSLFRSICHFTTINAFQPPILIPFHFSMFLRPNVALMG
jgi:hypothetical protein